MNQNIKETVQNSESTSFMEENQESHQNNQVNQNPEQLSEESFSDNGELTPISKNSEETQDAQSDSKRKNGKSKEFPSSKKYELLMKNVENEPLVDHKLQLVIDFMEEALSQSGTPLFKNFWDARKMCANLFKENISPGVRAHLWSRYGELTKQARSLKEILDEQTSFAVEQIEIAVNALESDLEKSEFSSKTESELDTSFFPIYLKSKTKFYQDLQSELAYLNVSASRINSLRKELIKTEMRIKQKNKFFQKLSSIGDKVFPRRKDLIKEVSQKFHQDVESFINEHFGKEESNESLHILRDEIKKFQSIAKILTLNTQSFTSTRLCLSKCWDKVKVEEKERKKHRAEKRAVSKENANEVFDKISVIKGEIESQSVSIEEGLKRLQEISSAAREIELERDEVISIRDSLTVLRKILLSRQQQEEETRLQKLQEKQQQRKQQYTDLRCQLEKIIQEQESLTVEQITEELQKCKESVKAQNLNKVQRLELDPLFRSINDALSEKQETSILKLSEDDRDQLQELNHLLQQRIQRRKEIKDQLEILRKSAGSSGLGFEQAIKYNQMIEAEKTRMDKTLQAIQEIEEKIARLKKK